MRIFPILVIMGSLGSQHIFSQSVGKPTQQPQLQRGQFSIRDAYFDPKKNSVFVGVSYGGCPGQGEFRFFDPVVGAKIQSISIELFWPGYCKALLYNYIELSLSSYALSSALPLTIKNGVQSYSVDFSKQKPSQPKGLLRPRRK